MTKTRLLIMALLVLAVISLTSVGVAYGRYSDIDACSMGFQSFDSSLVQLHGVTPRASREAGEWQAIATEFITGASGEKLLPFCVSNGSDRAHFSASDIHFSIRMTVSEGFSPESASVSIAVAANDDSAYPEEYTVYAGVAETIDSASALYKDYGAGTLYCFYDAEGNELSLPLEGGMLSVKNMIISVSGDSGTGLINYYLIPTLD